MGKTRVIFTDATTAEAINTLKTLGYFEVSEGGCFVDNTTAIKIFVVWGKAKYYPDLLDQITFTPRIQIHFKTGSKNQSLAEIVQSCAQGLKLLSDQTQIQGFNVNSGKKIAPVLLKN